MQSASTVPSGIGFDLPRRHVWHAALLVWPGSGFQLPAGHSLKTWRLVPWGVGQKPPAGQSSQLVALSADVKEPAAHGSHSRWPLRLLNRPGPQMKQSSRLRAASLGIRYPGGQSAQALSPSSLQYWPRGHGSHCFKGGGKFGPEAYRADSAVEGAAGEWRIVGRDGAAFGGPLAARLQAQRRTVVAAIIELSGAPGLRKVQLVIRESPDDVK